MSNKSQFGRFSKIAREILNAERVSTYLHPTNTNFKAVDLKPDENIEKTVPVGSGFNKPSVVSISSNLKKSRLSQKQPSNTSRLSKMRFPSRLSVRGLDRQVCRQSSSSRFSKASSYNFLRRRYMQQSSDSGSSTEEEETPAPLVLNFLYSNDANTTRTKYAEEWVSNTKFSDSGSLK